ncbi:hypothetical protein Y032_0008g58 [Ancylostoma ceylanicum]|uniref:Uncharacterized protein n=1 Tax=Ancylostoma ceylanicum TaxID=53326 RepID=A0A016VMI9_9BILA|nr:hypothetical protein Y032_0008g58 [Ancylostoma ceylanicum]
MINLVYPRRRGGHRCRRFTGGYAVSFQVAQVTAKSLADTMKVKGDRESQKGANCLKHSKGQSFCQRRMREAEQC